MLSPRAAGWGARGTFAVFMAVILTHIALLSAASVQAVGKHPGLILPTLLLLAIMALPIWFAWSAFLHDQPLAQIGGFATLLLYTVFILAEDPVGAARSAVLYAYVLALWFFAIAGTLLARRAGLRWG